MMKQFLIVLLSVASVVAQNDPFFPKPSYFRKHFLNVPTKVELEPPVRLADFVAGGKLELSLKNYLDLVMQNNPDIGIQKVNVEFARDAILRAFSVFDPIATAGFTTTRQLTPSGSLLAGADTINALTQPFSLGYTQTISTGGQYNISFTDTKTSSNSAFTTFNPQLSAGFNMSFTQPLLRGRGMFITRLPVSIARSKLKATQYTLEDQVTQLLAVAENAYWDVVNNRENLRVQEEALKLADAALQRAQKELELGATSPLEIYQPEANRANAELSVVHARHSLEQTEDALRRQIGADIDPKFREMPLVLTETLDMPPTTEGAIDRKAAVEDALRLRPDLRSNTQNLDVDDLGIKQANNALLPSLSFTAQYGSSGLGGIFYNRTNLLDPTAPVVPIPGGLGDALSSVFGFTYPVYGIGLRLTLPIRDRNAASNLADALAQKKLDALRVRQNQENVRLQVLNVIDQVENSRESIRVAKIARDLAQKRVEADQKRYELGTTTLFFVLDSQNAFVLAESSLVTETINYRRNLLNFYLRTGRLLEERNIVIR
ncbi:MAG TPA: TolC family protein [Bryobacteraceae bacterium]|nr:TolC family protein [Bryobacteraceae bacterium]